MINILKVSIFSLFFGVLFIVSCNMKVVNKTDGEKHITNEMDEVISDYIIHKYSSSYMKTDKQFEVHKIYGTSELDGVLSVYMRSYYGGFNKSTGIVNQAGHSIPAVIRLSNKDENYSVIEYIEPRNGNLYQSSLKKMFPKKYLNYVQQEGGDMEDLQKKMDIKVRQWLEQK